MALMYLTALKVLLYQSYILCDIDTALKVLLYMDLFFSMRLVQNFGMLQFRTFKTLLRLYYGTVKALFVFKSLKYKYCLKLLVALQVVGF